MGIVERVAVSEVFLKMPLDAIQGPRFKFGVVLAEAVRL